jgi:hypothetical protein
MSVEMQSWITWGAVGLSAGWIITRAWSTWNGFSNARCGSDACSCSTRVSTQSSEPRLQLGIRRSQQGLTIGKPASHQPR